MSVHRRHFLAGGAAALGGTALGWGARGLTTDEAAPASAGEPVTGGDTVAFHGIHQAGIDTAPQAHLSLLGLNLLPESADDLEALGRLLRLLSDDAARLTQGEGALADTEPELATSPARLTVTFGVGPRVLRLLRPAYDPQLTDLPGFSRDALDPAWGQTDLLVQICSDDPVTVAHTRRMLLKDAAPFATTAWVQDGFRRARGSEAAGTTMRNLMGQVDGTVNLGSEDFGDLLWSVGAAADYDGGTFLALRRIAMDLTDWDRTDRVAREFSVGRTLATGAPLTGEKESDTADFEAVDQAGFPVIDPASHIARVRALEPTEQFLRRAYNYTDDAGGAGLLFCAYSADLTASFVPVQQRMDEEDLLNEWVATIGSAVYAIPPGCVEGDYVGRALLGLEPPTVTSTRVAPDAAAAAPTTHTGRGGTA